jgi:VanZ family protein
MRSFLKYWLPLIAWMLLIFAGSTDALSAEQTSRFLVPFLRWLDPQISVATIATIHFALRKLGHLTEYGVFAALLWRAMRGTLRSRRSVAIAALVFIVSAMFAASDEFHQSFVPTRTASSSDVLIDMCGAILGLIVCFMFTWRRKSQATE